MLIAELTERRAFALLQHQTAAAGWDFLSRHKMSFIPVIQPDEQIWIGNVYRHELLTLKTSDITLGELARRDDVWIPETHHILDAARIMLRAKVDAIPVLNDHFHYEGFVKQENVSAQLTRLLNAEELGQVLFIEMEQQDFTLAQIVRFIEEEKGRILGLMVESPNTLRETFRVSIKINLMEAGRIVASLRRHGYTVSTPNNDEWLDAEFGERAEELMHFLEM